MRGAPSPLVAYLPINQLVNIRHKYRSLHVHQCKGRSRLAESRTRGLARSIHIRTVDNLPAPETRPRARRRSWIHKEFPFIFKRLETAPRLISKIYRPRRMGLTDESRRISARPRSSAEREPRANPRLPAVRIVGRGLRRTAMSPGLSSTIMGGAYSVARMICQ